MTRSGGYSDRSRAQQLEKDKVKREAEAANRRLHKLYALADKSPVAGPSGLQRASQPSPPPYVTPRQTTLTENINSTTRTAVIQQELIQPDPEVTALTEGADRVHQHKETCHRNMMRPPVQTLMTCSKRWATSSWHGPTMTTYSFGSNNWRQK